jgi:hypothetical protein
MLANARDARRRMMRTSDLQPPRAGLNSDPVLYGVAVGLAALFPPVKAANAAAEPTRTGPSNRAKGTAGAA